MALSGTGRKIFTNNSSFELILSWTATQNIGANTSTVVATLSIRGINSWSSVSDATASATSITIDGNTKNFTATSTVSGGKTKVLGTHTHTITHSANGSKSFTLSGSHYWDINWNGGGTQTVSLSNSYALNTIPRASNGSGSNFTFTSNSAFSISRASSTFTHKVRFHVDNLFIKEMTGVGASGTFAFTDAERRSIITKMAGRTSVGCRVDLWTYSGTTQVGSMATFSYNVTAPATAGLTVNAFTISTAGFPITLTSTNSGAKFSYNVTWTFGTFNKKVTGVPASYTFPLTATDVNSMLGNIPNANSGVGSAKVESFFDGVAFGSSYTTPLVTARVNTSAYAPVVKAGTTYKDTNSKTVSITGNNQIIISNVSTIQVVLPAGLGTAQGGATLRTTRIAIGGKTKELAYSASATTVDFGTISVGSNTTAVVTVIDSRSNVGTWSVPITVVPYGGPVLTPEIVRVNGFDPPTRILLAGTYSRITIGGVDKNSITKVTYRYKARRSDIWDPEVSIAYTATGGTLRPTVTTGVIVNLDNGTIWDVEVKATDTLGTVTTYSQQIREGIPLMFMDTDKRSLGFGMLPSRSNVFQMSGDIEAVGSLTAGGETHLQGNVFMNSGKTIQGGGGFWNGYLPPGDMKQSSYWHQTVFPKGYSLWGKTPDTGQIGNPNDVNGWALVTVFKDSAGAGEFTVMYYTQSNGRVFRLGGNHTNSRLTFYELYSEATPGIHKDWTPPTLWSGVAYMTANQTITPSKSLEDCRNGWMLAWSDYTNGVANNYDWVFTPVPKSAISAGVNGMHAIVANSNAANAPMLSKYIYVGTGTTIVGQANNNLAGLDNVVLRKVYEW